MEAGWLTVWRAQVWSQAADAFEAGAAVAGSGSTDAHVGQLAFLYVTRPVGGVVAVLSVAGPPRVPDTDLAAASPWAKTIVDYTVHAVLDPPLPIADLRADATLGASYPVRRNMNLTVAALNGAEAAALVALAERQRPELREALDAIVSPEPPMAFGSEQELEQWLVDHLDQLAEIDGTEYRLADMVVDGIGGRQPMLPNSDTRPDLVLVDDRGPEGQRFVVVEVKNVPARPEHVGKLAHYVSWIRQHLPGAADARGLLLTTGNTLAASTALQLVPALSQLSVSDFVVLGPREPFDLGEYSPLDLMRGASNVLADRLTCLTATLDSRSFITRDSEPDMQRVWEGVLTDLQRLSVLLDEAATYEPEDPVTPS